MDRLNGLLNQVCFPYNAVELSPIGNSEKGE